MRSDRQPEKTGGIGIMTGYLLLEGGAEFGGEMAEVDKRAMALAGGTKAPIDIIPAAAAPDGNQHRACRQGVDWFTGLGARAVTCRGLVDSDSARDPDLARNLARSRLVYMLGGFPGHLARSLKDTPAWESLQTVLRKGGVVGGSSAGAMVLGEWFFDPFQDRMDRGLCLLPNVCILPHHDRGGADGSRRLRRRLGGVLLVGIDERTGMINDAPSGGWTVYGRGGVTLYRPESTDEWPAGKVIPAGELAARDTGQP
jgi:cyanophycinase